MKDLESEVFSVTSLREWLQARVSASAGGEIAATEPPAVASTPAPEMSAATPAASPTQAVHAVEARTVTGKVTFQNLLDWGVSVDAIQSIIGASLPDSAMLVKDYASQEGLDFASLKSALQAAVDEAR